MQLECPSLDIYVPDGTPLEQALARTTHLGIGAHPDDLEIMAIPGILQCHQHQDYWFTGVVLCDGASSPRQGQYANFSDADMARQRRQEQRAAAQLGGYSVQLQLGYSSEQLRRPAQSAVIDNLALVLAHCKPHSVYLHNPADAHATHRAAVSLCMQALQALPQGQLPAEVHGVEVWRSLDWLTDPFRRSLPVSDPGKLQQALLRCHDSQVSGGKRYDTAIIARQQANATLAESHAVDQQQPCALAMNLRPVLEDPSVDLPAYLQRCLREFSGSLTDD